MPGALLIGDTAGLLNVPKIKGTHQAIRSRHARRRTSRRQSTIRPGFDAKLRASEVMAELQESPQLQARLQARASGSACSNAGWETVTCGLSPWTLKSEARLVVAGQARRSRTARSATTCERTLAPRDRLAGVYFAATEHDEDQPVHLQVRRHQRSASPRCAEEYGNPCTRFCPAGVYEIVEDARRQAPADQRRQLRALQDLRHQGSVRDHQLGDAGRRSRGRITRTCKDTYARSRLRRRRPSAG